MSTTTFIPGIPEMVASVSVAFPTTHWSVVLTAAQTDSVQAQEALSKLCYVYWYPLYAFVRRRGHATHVAEDLIQEFFWQLITKRYLAGITAEGGRFRSYLLTVLNHFLANEWQKLQTQKRGGKMKLVSLDLKSAEERYQFEPTDKETPETLFQRRWASAVLDQVMVALEREYTASGKAMLFRVLRGFLSGTTGQIKYAALGVNLGMSEAAVKQAVFRLRRRYGELLRAQIASTVNSHAEIDDEIMHLIAVFSR